MPGIGQRYQMHLRVVRQHETMSACPRHHGGVTERGRERQRGDLTTESYEGPASVKEEDLRTQTLDPYSFIGIEGMLMSS